MKVLRTLFLAAAVALPLSAAAQTGSPGPQATGAPDAAALQRLREKIRSDRKALVAQNLPLTDAEAKAFWPVYGKCHQDLESAQRASNRAILDYVNGESSMTNAFAKKIVNDLLAAETREARARKSCFDRVAKVLPGKKAARYIQIESKIRALSRFDAAVAIPLID